MKLGYRLIRVFLVTIIVLVAVVPAVLYVALSLSGVQRSIADRAEQELSQLLDAKVTIGSLGIVPFNRVILRDVAVETAPGDTALSVQRLGAGVPLFDLLLRDRWRVDYLELVGADARLRRDSVNGPLNIQPIIEALKPKDKTKPPTKFDLKVSSVIVRTCAVSYDVLDRPEKPTIDPNHLHVRNLRADITLPRITNDDFTVALRRLAFEERSGLTVENLAGDFHIAANELSAKNLAVKLPSSSLHFSDMMLPIDGFDKIGQAVQTEKLTVSLLDGAHLWLPDLGWLDNRLVQLREMVTIPEFQLEGNPAFLTAKIQLEMEDKLTLDLEGEGRHLLADRRSVILDHLDLTTGGEGLYSELAMAGILPPQYLAKAKALGAIDLSLKGKGSAEGGDVDLDLACDLGRIVAEVDGEYHNKKDFSVKADVATDGYFNLSPFLPDMTTAGFDGQIRGDFRQHGASRAGNLEAELEALSFKGRDFGSINIVTNIDDNLVKYDLAIDDPNLNLVLTGTADLGVGNKAVTLEANLDRMMPDRLGLWDKYPGAMLHGQLTANLSGGSWEKMEGNVNLENLQLRTVGQGNLALKRLNLTAQNLNDSESRLLLESDYLDGKVEGMLNFPRLGHSVLDILAVAFPSLLPSHNGHEEDAVVANDFVYDFTLKPSGSLSQFFHLPIEVVYPVTIRGGMSDHEHELVVNLSAPYLYQKGKMIRETSLSAYVDGDEERARLDFTTQFPTKNGPMTVKLSSSGHDDRLRADLDWKIDRARAYEGTIKTVTNFSRPDNQLLTSVELRKSSLTFNDSTWIIDPAKITIQGKTIDINGINAYHSNQYVKIDGRIADEPTALLTLDLRQFSLDYLFESLGIDAAMLGGDATGTFYASDLYSGHPALVTPGLNVKDISYNHTVLGDAVVRSRFNPQTMAAELAADIDNDGRRSTVEGAIFATRDSLDLTFHVDREPVGFLQPYMEAFASDIKGYASGWARVYGNFKYIDLEGDVFADSVQLKVNFTNTTYWATDSVHIRPGYIDLNGITVHDFRGHSAKLNGWVRHKFFKEPRFEFAISGAKELLCYDETPKENPRWYGRIFGNGGAHVKGAPGIVDISVDMTTAPGSTFTFVLSDQVEAEQYSFLTFRDRGKMEAELTETVELADTSMNLVNQLIRQDDNHTVDAPSDYNISIQVGVTPDAQINLVMDPIGGDRIRSYGSGHLRMDYGSANNELKMFGNYTLDRGDYNFTLQDIIIKDFTIKPGSEITFRGDPYAAQLDIQAAYSLNANLSDLDESFLNDSELQRTNVPVNALMKVTGDIREPELAFDLEFPTLTSDVYRKVRSIISTDDMMNRQILYLLALNRFYTPDYMAGATRGNELVSVASSTISSQLSSILGQISDNWNIAPQFRSSRGDFSDVEVDVALSSRLLNNRLLFNGNLGYRDKSLNTNQFVGDFDLEYLLNRSGNIRLKAYNRYNDQNYYLRSALTTQGVGIVLRKDFDSLTSFMKPLLAPFRRKSKEQVIIPLALPADTTATTRQ